VEQAQFKFYSGLLKAYTEDTPAGKRRMLRTTASSTIRDLVGDEILPVAIDKMAEQARDNMTIWLNHSYQVPEDMLGSVRDAQVIQRGIDEEGNPIIDLDLDVSLEEANPRALQTWDAISNGTKLGTSIGAQVKHATKRKGGGLIIDDIHLLEASIVGIPANPRSWVQSAVKSLKTIDITTYGDTEKRSLVIDEVVEEEVVDEPITADIEPEKTDAVEETAEAEVEATKDADETVDDVADDSDKVAARTRVTVTVDSDAPEAPRSDPGNAREVLADETAQGDDEVLGDNVTRDVTVLPEVKLDTAMVQGMADAFKQAREQIADLSKELGSVTKERDDAIANLQLATALLDKIKDLPLARKALPTAELIERTAKSRFEGYFDPEVIKLLERK
jgi:Caudovirus prohead serine protease